MTTPITKLLVANRGEIALRVMRTARAMGIATVAVHSDPDAGEPFVAAADEAVALGGATPGESYLRMDAILGAASATGADAVHPGYGFLAENADFAFACAAAGLTFVGPPPAVMEAMGSKLAARELITAAGVPVVPGADVSRLFDDAALLDAAGQVGFPVLVKASAGGGGKGMRVVTEPAGLAEAVAAARREAASAFGDDTVFLERYVTAPRHVEVQIFGDHHGEVVSLFERECSIQRRHQKIIEESPSPALDDDLRARLCAAAVDAGRAAGYVGAGTVEFLLDTGGHPRSPGDTGGHLRSPGDTGGHPRSPGDTGGHPGDGEFFFLEVNARLQVEHPVTEMVTGLDLVRLQLLVAQGQPLPPEVRTAPLNGHAIEARLYAEDPEADFLPSPGRLHRFRIDASSDIRVESGVGDDSVVSPNYDPMLAKVIAWAPTWRRRPGAWPPSWPGPRSTASPPTGTCWCGSCATPSSPPAGPTPTSWSATPPPTSAVPWPAKRRNASTPPPPPWPPRPSAGPGPGCWPPCPRAGGTTRPGSTPPPMRAGPAAWRWATAWAATPGWKSTAPSWPPPWKLPLPTRSSSAPTRWPGASPST